MVQRLAALGMLNGHFDVDVNFLGFCPLNPFAEIAGSSGLGARLLRYPEPSTTCTADVWIGSSLNWYPFLDPPWLFGHEFQARIQLHLCGKCIFLQVLSSLPSPWKCVGKGKFGESHCTLGYEPSVKLFQFGFSDYPGPLLNYRPQLSWAADLHVVVWWFGVTGKMSLVKWWWVLKIWWTWSNRHWWCQRSLGTPLVMDHLECHFLQIANVMRSLWAGKTRGFVVCEVAYDSRNAY